MALIAKRTTNGFELVANLAGFPANPVPFELTPGVAFNVGNMVGLTAGKVVKAAAGATNVLGVMAESVTAAENAAGKTVKARVYVNPLDVFRCSFANHRDATATGGSTTTLIDTALTAATDDFWAGALLYVYDGPGAGSARIVKTYTAATKTLTVEEPFPAAITAASKYILLGAGAAVNDGIHPGGIGINIQASAASIDAGATINAEPGPLAVLSINPAELTMDVLIRKHRFNN